jgi:hypothetical protein
VQFEQRAQASKSNISSMWINSIGRSGLQNGLSREEKYDPLERRAILDRAADRYYLKQFQWIDREWNELERIERVNQQELERFEQKLRDELKEHGWLEQEGQEGQEEHLKQNPRNKELVWLKVAVAFICVWGIFLPYILARLFLWIEVFRTLCFLPSGAFVDTWSGSFPHIG